MSKANVKKVLEELIKQGRAERVTDGLCGVVYSASNHTHYVRRQWLEKCFASWPEFSGDISYPVRSPTSLITSKKAFLQFSYYVGDYGASRLRLAQHLLDNIEELPEC